jgi:hypothetical protein
MIGQSETRSSKQFSQSGLIYYTLLSLAGVRIFLLPFTSQQVSQVIFITLFSLSLSLPLSQVLGLGVPFTSLSCAKNYAKMLGQNHFADPKPPNQPPSFDLSSSNFNLQTNK